MHALLCAHVTCSLTRVLEPVQSGELTSSQKAVFLFLNHLFSTCSYLQATFRSSFAHVRMKVGEGALVDSYSPSVTEAEWQKLFLSHVSKPRCVSVSMA